MPLFGRSTRLLLIDSNSTLSTYGMQNDIDSEDSEFKPNIGDSSQKSDWEHFLKGNIGESDKNMGNDGPN